MSVYKKLSKARVMLQSKDMKKSGHNKFAGYSYFELGDFLPHINSIFDELGLCGVISYGQTDAVLNIVDVEDDSCVTISTPRADAPLKGCLPIQCLGAEETYLRRYLWVTAMEIVEHDAVDAAEPQKRSISPAKESIGTIAVSRQEALRSVAMDMTAAGTTKEAHDIFYGIGDQEEMLFVWDLLKSNSALRREIKKLHDVIEEQKVKE